jgi:cytochrome c-type biogenesis protein CcmH/NrfG
MSGRSATAPGVGSSRDTANRLERELLGRLGLSGDANSLDIQNAHDELIAFLERAPRDLGPWARRQIDLADEAFALLSDPTTSLPDGSTWPLQDAVVMPPVAALASAAEREEPTAAPPRANQLTSPVVGSIPRAGLPTRRVGPVGRALIAAVAVVAVVTVGYGVYASGAPSVPGLTGTPAPEASAGAQIDTTRVAELMTKIQADPTDAASLQALGDLYFQAQDYATAADWEKKVLALEPTNATAMLGLGAAEYNQGNAAEAEKQWRAVLAIDPKNLEAHYDLGFMYFSQDPPDVARVTAEWNSVIEIAPDSDIAKTVATHLKTLESLAASASPAGSAASSAGPSATAVSSAGPAASGASAPSPSPVAP